jgi:hypothetical protein
MNARAMRQPAGRDVARGSFRCEPICGLDCAAGEDEEGKACGVDGSSCVSGLEPHG